MRARHRIASLAVLALLAAPHARAGNEVDEVASARAASPAAPAATSPATSPARDAPLTTRDALGRQLDDEAASIERALAAVNDKLAIAQPARLRRLGAALRAVHRSTEPGRPDSSGVPSGDRDPDAREGVGEAPDDGFAVARRRAAIQLLLAHDRDERALLTDELGRLHGARARVAGEVAQLPSLTLPGELARPAPGKIARHFGVLEHERSKATLSRRGIDIEVEDRCPVTAPAAGIVRFAGPIRGLDHGVILDHGDYLTVIAKLSEVALPVGAAITAGDRLGRAARHRVYLEVRVKLGPGGLPIDPEPLLSASSAAPPGALPGAPSSAAGHSAPPVADSAALSPPQPR